MKSFTMGGNRKNCRPAAMVTVLCFMFSSALFAATAGPDPYEADDHHYQAGCLPLNGIEQGHTFHDAGDEDWLIFHGREGQIYYLGTRAPGSRCNTVFELFDAMGRMIDDEIGIFAETQVTGYGEVEKVKWQCPAAGTYYLRVMQEDPDVFGDDTEYALYLWDGKAPEVPLPVYGEVVDGVTLKPVRGASVKLVRTADQQLEGDGVTNNRGIFQLSGPNGDYRLEVRATGYRTQKKPVEVKGEPVEIHIALAPTATPKPDLAVSAVSGPVKAQRGDTLAARYTLANKGTVTSGKFTVALYLSPVPRIDFARSRLLRVIRDVTLDAGARSERTTNVKVPSDMEPGPCWIVVGVDPANRLAEISEANNRRASANTVAVE